MLYLVLAAALLLLQPSIAVFSDEAWNVDYHYALLGEPKQDTTFFHQPNPDSKASLVYTLSERGVLGAVNPRDGTIVWRQLLANDITRANTSFLRAGQDDDVVISGIGTEVAAWSASDGKLSWSSELGGQIKDVEMSELPDGAAAASVKDAIVLSAGASPKVRRVDGASGHVKWQFAIDGGDVPYQVSVSSTEIYAILLHETMRGNIKIRVISLDPVDGHKTDEYTLSSDSDLSSTDNIVSVGANSASPIIAWIDPAYSTLKVNLIGTKGTTSFNIEKDADRVVERVRVHAPYHSNSRTHFLVHFSTATSHWAEVYHVDLAKGSIKKAYSLPVMKGNGAFATSVSDVNVYFTRITSTEVMTVSSVSHGILGRWPVDGWNVAKGRFETVEPIHAVCELSIKGDAISAIRSAVMISTGDWVLLREGSTIWHRPETLAGTVAATFATPQVFENLARQLEVEARSNVVSAYIRRLTRHLDDLRSLPAKLPALPQWLIGGFLGTSADDPSGDSFGFHKMVVCATDSGRLIAIDAADPYTILWNRRLMVDMTIGQGVLRSVTNGVLGFVSDTGAEERFFNASTGTVLTDTTSPILAKDLADAVPIGNIRFTLRGGSLKAYRSSDDRAPLWHFSAQSNERIVSLVPRPVNDPVASIGKVLGDRRVLYKYLNSNLALLVTANDVDETARFYVLDTISGAILHSNAYNGVDLSSPIASTMSENWFAYSFTIEASEFSSKGHALVVGEMFESLIPNDRGPLSVNSNVSTMQNGAEPFTIVQTFQIPEAISKLAVTQTKQGITSRQLLALLADSGAIVGIPYGAIDPRRPVGREPTKDEQMEGLMRYSPVVDFDPRWLLNHQRELVGMKNIVTTPALIESTSIVFAYGLDMFGTRLSPSFSFDILGKDFNKFQMLATVAALAVATFVVAPLVCSC